MVSIFQSLTRNISFESKGENYDEAMKGPKVVPKEPENTEMEIPFVESLDFFGDNPKPAKVPKTEQPKPEKEKPKHTAEIKIQPGSAPQPIPQPLRNQDIHATVILASDSATKKKLKSRKARRKLQSGALSVPVPPAVSTFAALTANGVPHQIIQNLEERGMAECTPVQQQAIPALLSSLFDASAPMASLVCAPTGSGKTIAYLVPLVTFVRQYKDKIQSDENSSKLSGIVIVPTRELAIQIEREVLFVTNHLGIHCMHRDKSKSQITKQDVLVSTPKRILSLFADEKLSPKNFKFCVFDEFDRLFDTASADMHAQTVEILNAIPQDKAIIGLFSATIPQKLEEKFRKLYTKGYYRILVGNRVAPTSSITQKLQYVRDEGSKIDALRRLITGGFRPPMLIFVHTADRCEQFSRSISTPSLRVGVLSKNLNEKAKNVLIEQFRLGEIFILITTDVLARGIDFKDVGTVVNADIPLTAENYVHRIGRCGRAGGQGTAITFFTDDDRIFVPTIAKMITSSGQKVEDYITEMKQPSGGKLKRARIALGQRYDLPF